jgi:hypothetical protein
VASVLALAVRLRLGDSGAPPRNRAWGDAVRLVALLGLLARASLATVALGNLLWYAGQLPGLAPPQDPWVADVVGRWPAVVVGFATVPAYAALLLGRLHVARVLAVLGLAPLVLAAGARTLAGEPHLVERWTVVLLDMLLVLALWTWNAPPVPRRPWLAALPVGVGVAFGTDRLAQQSWTWLLVDWAAICCAAVVGGALVYLGAVALRRVRPSAPWSLGLLLFTAAVFVQRVLTAREQVDTAPQGYRATIVLVDLGEVVAMLAVAVPLVILARRAVHRLPAAAVAEVA